MITQKLEESIKLYQTGIPMLKVCSTTGISFSTLQRHLQQRGLSRSNKQNSRKYQVDHSYFNIIDSEDKAYWLGFLYADGYVSKRTKQKLTGCAIHEDDSPHLEKLKQSLKATYPIKHYISISYGVRSPYARLLITSDQLFDDLVKLGVVEHKSLVLQFPNQDQVPIRLANHFIRGYFDGDGSFSKSHDGYTVKICGTKEFLNTLSEHIGFPNRNLTQRKKNGKNNYCLEIGGRLQVTIIGDYMYQNATIWMGRKHKRYLKNL